MTEIEQFLENASSQKKLEVLQCQFRWQHYLGYKLQNCLTSPLLRFRIPIFSEFSKNQKFDETSSKMYASILPKGILTKFQTQSSHGRRVSCLRCNYHLVQADEKAVEVLFSPKFPSVLVNS